MSDYTVEAACDVIKATRGRGAEYEALEDWNARMKTDTLKTAHAVLKLHEYQVGALFLAIIGVMTFLFIGVGLELGRVVIFGDIHGYWALAGIPLVILAAVVWYRKIAARHKVPDHEAAVEKMVSLRNYIDGFQAVREGERLRQAATLV